MIQDGWYDGRNSLDIIKSRVKVDEVAAHELALIFDKKFDKC